MSLTAEEAYLEELWRDNETEEDQLSMRQSQVVGQHDPLPTYRELMGHGSPPITLRRAARQPQQPLASSPARTNGPLPAAATTNGHGASSSPSKRSPLPLPPSQLHHATSSPAKQPGTGTIPHALGLTVGNPGAGSLAANGVGVVGGMGAGGADADQLRKQLAAVVSRVEAHQGRYEQVLLEARKAADLVRSMEAEISSLQAEADELSRRRPPAPERSRQVATWLAQRGAALEAQRGVADGRQLELIAAEAGLRAAETELEFLADAREELEEAKAADTAALGAATAALRAREERVAAGYGRKLAAAVAAVGEATRQDDAQKRIAAAEAAHEQASERIKASQQRIREGIAAGREALAAEQARRREAVLGLKGSLAAVRAEVAAQAELQAVLQRQRRELHDKEFSALVESGLNPYEVFRRRDMEAEAQRQREQVRSNIASRQLEVAAALAREQEAYQRTVAQRQADKAAREEFDREMGVAARNARTDEYLRTHTAAGVTMLDPTGHAPFDPSSAVVAKTAGFGRGGASPALLEQQLGRLGRGTAPKELLLPAKYRGPEGAMGAGVAGGADAELVAALTARTGGASDEDGDGPGSPPRSPSVTQRVRAAQLGSTAGHGAAPGLGAAAGGAGSGAGGAGGAGGGGGDKYKQLATRPLTTLEQGLMERAKERHKTAIGTPQTQMGRTFAGDAFLPSPALVEFRDFEVGRTVTAAVQVINRSYRKNTFRVLGIPVEYLDVLDFSYKLPGYLAPGVSGEVLISFTPKAPVDIDTQLELLADTGPFKIPIRCRTKRAQLSVSPTHVDFGAGVTLGETATRTFVIANDGGLEVEYRLDSPQLSEDERALLKSTANLNHLMTSATVAAAAAAATAAAGARSAKSFAAMGVSEAVEGRAVAPTAAPREERRLAHAGFSIFPCVGLLKGYSKVTFTVSFAPTIAAATRLQLHVTYKAPSIKRLPLPHHEVLLTGVGRDVPVYVERPLIDFKCCMLGHLYRDVLVVRNGGKSAMKVTVVPRPELEGFFEFSPDFGFVQAGDAFPITIRFKPTPALLAACRRHLLEPPEEQLLEVPMRLAVPDQALPVPFTLRAQLTNTDLTFDPPILDFGDCVLSERTALQLSITNPGRLPQTFGFIGLPPGLQLSPNDGYGYVLPGETLQRTVSFQPPIAGPQTFSMSARTLAGRSFELPCRACGVAPALSLSHNRLRMAATAVGDSSSVSVVLVNRTDSQQAFEFAVPPDSDLTFSPHVGEVPPQSRLRVQITHTPRPPEEGEEDALQAEAEAAAARERQEQEEEEEEERRRAAAADSEDEDDSEGGGVGAGGIAAVLAGRKMVGAGAGGQRGMLAGAAGGRSGSPGQGGEDGWDEELDEPPSGSPRARRPGSPPRSPGSPSRGGSRGADGTGGGTATKGVKAFGIGLPPMGDLEDEEQDQDQYQDDEEHSHHGQAPATTSPAPTPSWYRWREHAITCYIRPPGAAPQPSQASDGSDAAAGGTGLGPADGANGGGGGGSVPSAAQQLHLQLSTCAVLPDLVLTTELPYVPVHGCHALDFGPVPVGQRVVRTLELTNEGSEPLLLRADALDSREVFCVVNAMRMVRPGGNFRLLLAFTPQARTEYLEVLTVRSALTHVRVALKGAGIAPELQLSPPGATTSGLDLGDVAVGESSSTTLTVTNVCPFPLSFAMRLAARATAADPNLGCRLPFACQPAEGTLAQGESCEVAVSFRPSSQRPYFEDVLQVVVPNQQEQLLVPLRGRGWREAVFVAGPDYPPVSPDPFLIQELARQTGVPLPPSVSSAPPASSSPATAAEVAPGGGTAAATPAATPPPGSTRGAGAKGGAAAAAPPPVLRTLTLTFPHAVYPGESATASFDVGNLKSTEQGGAPAEVTVAELPPEARDAGWAVEGLAAGGKLPLAAGERKPLTVTYTAPRVPHPGMVAAYGHAEYRTIRIMCVLKGGLMAFGGGPEGRAVVVLARCRLLPGARPAGEAPPTGVVAAAPVVAAAAGKKVPATPPAGSKPMTPAGGGKPPAAPAAGSTPATPAKS